MPMMSRAKALAALILVLGVVLAACSSGSAVLETVEPETAAETIASDPETIVLDIRTPAEYEEGIIEGAINIDFYAPDFAAQLAQLDPNASYVVYCRSGNRSGEAMATFADLEFQQVSEIGGGIVNWYQDGLPIVMP